MRLIWSCLVVLFIANTAFAQMKPASTEAEYEKSYEWRVKQQNLFGVYIPADIGEVFQQLTSLSDKNDRDKFKRLSEHEAATVPFFGLGRWISLNWGFYGGSRLSAYLNQLGLFHPDDMTRFILIMYNRHLNEAKLNPKEVIEGLIEARQEYNQKRALEGEVIHEETRVLERPDEGGK